MKNLLGLLFILIASCATTQEKSKPEDFGFRHLRTVYKGDTVEIVLRSAKGEEQLKKPLFLFCQGSLPQPLIKKADPGTYSVFPFVTDSLEKEYHIAIVSKPYVPLIADASRLGENFIYLDSSGNIPRKYSERNLPEYYIGRNLQVISYLQKLSFIDRSKLVVAGHSEGSTIAAGIAARSHKVTHLIYSGGNPLGRIMTIIAQARASETDTDSTRFGEYEHDYWSRCVAYRKDMDDSHGDTYKATYDFSNPPLKDLQKLKIPVLVCYGTRDWSALSNDFLRTEMVRQERSNFTFLAYIGLEHNFFPLSDDGSPDYSQFNWNRVGEDWRIWVGQH